MAESKTAVPIKGAEIKEEPVSSLNIYQKLAKISQAIGVMEKDTAGYNYNYVSEDKVQAKLNGAMQTYHVHLMFEIVHGTEKVETIQTLNKKGEPSGLEYRYSAEVLYTWVNLDNLEDKKVVPWVIVGQMADPSQAFGAAVTYCNRYFLLKEFQLPTTNDDPDKIRSLQQEAAEHDLREANKKKAEELKPLIDQIGELGKQLIQNGLSREDLLKVIADHNGGESSRSKIQDAGIAKAIIEALTALLKTETENK